MHSDANPCKPAKNNSGVVGREFESLRAHQTSSCRSVNCDFFGAIAKAAEFALCLELCPPKLEEAAKTAPSDGRTQRLEIATELCPAIRASVQASQPDLPRRVGVCMAQAAHANIKRSNAIRKSAAVPLTRIMFIPSLKEISSDGPPLHIGAEGDNASGRAVRFIPLN